MAQNTMNVGQLVGTDFGDKVTKYAAAMGATPEEVYGVWMGVAQPFLCDSTVQAGDHVVKNDLNIVVADTSGNAGKCARRLQEIRNQLLDPQEAKRLTEQDIQRVVCDPVTGKQTANLDETTSNGLFVMKPEAVVDVLQNKALEGKYLVIGHTADSSAAQVLPAKSKGQQKKDAKVIKEIEGRFARTFRGLMDVRRRQTQFRLSPDGEKALKEICSKKK
ncbi:uncharacterized protein LOC129595725 isoform X2 [Paramacrobiotus metropolitanus]|nr:uncharacterized protein LOC129595725 isoform X2 [Paramacrobiotus metropolitanus]XP_055348783.1 uncharacterized protein LOC129595725 isoform X2 [Paramacrobiotus metropolitanus]XP_055348784.1 uncharacterized protein LOC129595725 isoform X2 [Paramacrobiotus metropolitanus]